MENKAVFNKKIHIEALRSIAIALVLFNHTGTNGFQLYTITSNRYLYYIYMFLGTFCKIAVPIFFMISGALILGKEESLKDLYKKRVLKIIYVLILFSIFQYLLKVISGEFPLNIIYFLKKLYNSKMIIPYWYLYAYISFLVMVPFLRKMLKNMNQSDYKYFFLVYFIIAFILPFIEKIFGITRNNDLNFILKTQYIFFPIAGYYLENIISEENIKKCIPYGIILSIISHIIVIIFTVSEIKSSGDPLTQKWLGAYTAAPTITVYIVVKYIFTNYKISNYIKNIISIIGTCTFGIYLIEYNLRKLFMLDMINLLKLDLCQYFGHKKLNIFSLYDINT